jgi:hypothetical protein
MFTMQRLHPIDSITEIHQSESILLVVLSVGENLNLENCSHNTVVGTNTAVEIESDHKVMLILTVRNDSKTPLIQPCL